MLNAEIIVGLWFVPVVLFIIIPLSMLCFWTAHQFLRKLTDKIGLIHKSPEEAGDGSYVPGLRPRAAVQIVPIRQGHNRQIPLVRKEYPFTLRCLYQKAGPGSRLCLLCFKLCPARGLHVQHEDSTTCQVSGILAICMYFRYFLTVFLLLSSGSDTIQWALLWPKGPGLPGRDACTIL